MHQVTHTLVYVTRKDRANNIPVGTATLDDAVDHVSTLVVTYAFHHLPQLLRHLVTW